MSRMIVALGLVFDSSLGVISIFQNFESLVPVTLLCLASSVGSALVFQWLAVMAESVELPTVISHGLTANPRESAGKS